MIVRDHAGGPVDDATCAFDPDDPDTFSLGSGDSIRLWYPHDPYGDGYVHALCAELGGNGMTAALHSITVTDNGLSDFLSDLAEETLRDSRRWTSDHQELSVEAEPVGRGHVRLTWTLRPRHVAEGEWSASVRVDVEGGAELKRIGADLDRFLGDTTFRR